MESYKEQPFKKQSYKKYISLKKLRFVANNKQSFKKQPSKKQLKTKHCFFVHSIKMANPSLNELETIAKIRGIKGYRSMSEERLLSVLNESESAKESEKNIDDARIEKIKKDFNKLRERLSKPKIKEIRKDLYRIENKKTLSPQKIEKIFKLKKYHDYDNIEYKGIRDVKNLFDLSTNKDYYKLIKTNDAFNSNYIEYESKGDKNKTLSVKEYLNMIRSYLRDIINDHKTQGEW